MHRARFPYAQRLTFIGLSRKEGMDEPWNLIRIRARTLVSFAYPSGECALFAALDLCDSPEEDLSFYIEDPENQRIDQRDINPMGFMHRDVIVRQ
jgi:hypothetical protein